MGKGIWNVLLEAPVSSFIYSFQKCRHTSVLAEHLLCAKHGTKAFGRMMGLLCVFWCKVCIMKLKCRFLPIQLTVRKTYSDREKVAGLK